jgi:hypothetical protein
MAMSVVDSNVRGISDLISAVHMSQSTHADMNLANHISNESKKNKKGWTILWYAKNLADWHEEFGNQQTAAEILATPRESKMSINIKNVDFSAEEGRTDGDDEINPTDR